MTHVSKNKVINIIKGFKIQNEQLYKRNFDGGKKLTPRTWLRCWTMTSSSCSSSPIPNRTWARACDRPWHGEPENVRRMQACACQCDAVWSDHDGLSLIILMIMIGSGTANLRLSDACKLVQFSVMFCSIKMMMMMMMMIMCVCVCVCVMHTCKEKEEGVLVVQCRWQCSRGHGWLHRCRQTWCCHPSTEHAARHAAVCSSSRRWHPHRPQHARTEQSRLDVIVRSNRDVMA